MTPAFSHSSGARGCVHFCHSQRGSRAPSSQDAGSKSSPAVCPCAWAMCEARVETFLDLVGQNGTASSALRRTRAAPCFHEEAAGGSRSANEKQVLWTQVRSTCRPRCLERREDWQGRRTPGTQLAAAELVVLDDTTKVVLWCYTFWQRLEAAVSHKRTPSLLRAISRGPRRRERTRKFEP